MRIDQPVGQNLALQTYRTLLEQCVFNDDQLKHFPVTPQFGRRILRSIQYLPLTQKSKL